MHFDFYEGRSANVPRHHHQLRVDVLEKFDLGDSTLGCQVKPGDLPWSRGFQSELSLCTYLPHVHEGVIVVVTSDVDSVSVSFCLHPLIFDMAFTSSPIVRKLRVDMAWNCFMKQVVGLRM